MKTTILLALVIITICLVVGKQLHAAKEMIAKKKTRTTVYDFPLKTIDGEDITLEDYKGKLLLIVNVASRCGFTSQYKGLEKLYQDYKDQGLVVIGFPANNFGSQEPGSNEEIQRFCSTTFNVSFPMMAKISVKGKDSHPLYQYLTSKKSGHKFGGGISWNFNKFIISREGEILGRFGSMTKPMDKKVLRVIEAALEKNETKNTPGLATEVADD
jgi:glutathione peroxidase-family protein